MKVIRIKKLPVYHMSTSKSSHHLKTLMVCNPNKNTMIIQFLPSKKEVLRRVVRRINSAMVFVFCKESYICTTLFARVF